MPGLLLATWNVNSVRLRIDRIVDFLKKEKVDIVCLQEIKCLEDQFPRQAFAAAGFKHAAIAGQKGMHGVATVSRKPIEQIKTPDFCQNEHARVCAIKVAGYELHNLYVPAGADIPDPKVNDKFAHKLDFLDRMNKHYTARAKKRTAPPLLVTGDINIAPEENDVWSHKQLLDVVSHTPIETDGLKNILKGGKFTDIARAKHTGDEKIFTWWSYRSPNWRKNNRGRRLDHIWADKNATPLVDIDSYKIYEHQRDGEKPSDHVPVTVKIKPAT